MRGLWGLGALAIAVLACGTEAYTCQSDGACDDGWCEPIGFCSFEDVECESGRRFGSQASDEFAGQCVEPSEDDEDETGDGASEDESDGGTTGDGGSGGDTVALDDEGDGSSDGSSDGGGETTGGDPRESDSDDTAESSGGTTPEADITVHNYVFVTSTQEAPGNLMGLEGADAFCNAAAADAGLPGTYVAWLSTTEIPARERLGDAEGWANTAGQPFAESVDALLAYDLVYPIRYDELGADAGSHSAVTATTEDGELDTSVDSGDCSGWTSTTGTVRHGRRSALGNTWTSSYQGSCSAPRRLYCFGVDDAVDVDYNFPTGNRQAFVADGLLPADAGLEGFDAQCRLEAEVAGLPNAELFQALVATSTLRAIDRFDLDGPPWQVVGGGLVVEVADDLKADDPPLIAPIHRGADGEPRLTYWVWSGASSPSVFPTDAPCADWTDTTGATPNGASGRTEQWFNASSFNCDVTRRVLCLENG